MIAKLLMFINTLQKGMKTKTWRTRSSCRRWTIRSNMGSKIRSWVSWTIRRERSCCQPWQPPTGTSSSRCSSLILLSLYSLKGQSGQISCTFRQAFFQIFKGSDQWEGRGFRRSPYHYMLVGEVVLDVFFVILMGCHLAWRVIYCSASKAKKKSICSK